MLPHARNARAGDRQANFLLAGQSNIGAWQEPENASALAAFREQFLSLSPNCSAVEFFPAFRGGSALLAEFARLNAQEYAADRKLCAQMKENFWFDPASGRFGRPMEMALARIERWRKKQGIAFRGIIWAQGEADAIHLGDAHFEIYVRTLETVLRRLQRLCDCECVYIQELGQLLPPGGRADAGAVLVRAAQRRVAAAMPGIEVATSTFDLPLRDTVHLTPQSHEIAARRMAKAIARSERPQ
ncbi:MAG: hypothetical protein HKN78_03380 [Sphingomonadaceae bacterium]|nr:hypothetical protein [Sphingomonadaceae bacterium]